jgi:hypothetical protein
MRENKQVAIFCGLLDDLSTHPGRKVFVIFEQDWMWK